MDLVDLIVIVLTIIGILVYLLINLIWRKSTISFGDTITSILAIGGAVQIFIAGISIVLIVFGFPILITNLNDLTQYLGIISLVLIIAGIYLFAKTMKIDISEYFKNRGKK